MKFNLTLLFLLGFVAFISAAPLDETQDEPLAEEEKENPDFQDEPNEGNDENDQEDIEGDDQEDEDQPETDLAESEQDPAEENDPRRKKQSCLHCYRPCRMVRRGCRYVRICRRRRICRKIPTSCSRYRKFLKCLKKSLKKCRKICRRRYGLKNWCRRCVKMYRRHCIKKSRG